MVWGDFGVFLRCFWGAGFGVFPSVSGWFCGVLWVFSGFMLCYCGDFGVFPLFWGFSYVIVGLFEFAMLDCLNVGLLISGFGILGFGCLSVVLLRVLCLWALMGMGL